MSTHAELRGHWLAPLIYAVATTVFLYPLAEPSVALSGGLAALAGSVAAIFVARTRLRTPVVFFGALLVVALSGLLRAALLDSAALAALLGPATALLVANLFALGLGGSFAALGLRTLALRRRVFSLLEVLVIGLAFAELVVAHRFGAINRPFELSDSIIAQGGDPTLALLAIGALAAALIVTLLLRERSVPRALLHLGLTLFLLSLVLTTTRVLQLPSPPPGASGLGLRPDEQEQRDRDREQGQRRRQDGHSDNERLDFRDNYDSQGRQVPLAVVLLHDDYSPPTGLYYFRQTAFSQYNGKRLVSATRAGVDTDIAPSFATQRVELGAVPNERGDRTALDTTVALLAEHTRPFALESAERLEPLQNPDAGRFRRVYRVRSSALDQKVETLLGQRLGDPRWGAGEREHYTQAPEDPRYRKLAVEIADTLHEELREDEVARALSVTLWLSREGTYSLKSGHAQAADPTADFLFGDRVGYCVHFAHAAVYLMRSLGIPARVGAGYVVEEAARQGGSSILVTGANSHAWPEFYVEGAGWVIADVAPERSLDPSPPPPDPDLQRLLGEMARGLKPLPQGQERALEPILHAAKALRTWLGRGLLVGAVVLTLLSYAIKLWRRAFPLFARKGLSRVAYRAQLDRLAELSLRRAVGESQESFAARVAATAPSFVALTDRHLAAVFASGHTPDPSEIRRLSRAVAHELRAGVSWFRRWLGVLSPWSWMHSR